MYFPDGGAYPIRTLCVYAALVGRQVYTTRCTAFWLVSLLRRPFHFCGLTLGHMTCRGFAVDFRFVVQLVVERIANKSKQVEVRRGGQTKSYTAVCRDT